MKNKKGFTLFELLAVIVILGIILLIAVPKVISTINDSKLGTLESTAKMVASQAEKEYITRSTMGTLNQTSNPITCNDVVNLSATDYSNCSIEFANDVAYVYIDGTGTFNGYSCLMGTKLDGNCGKTPYSDGSGANEPILYNNMIPVKYLSGNWVYADTSQEWYDYDQKEWANSVVLISSPSKTYVVGDTISMNDIAMMYVWIPRFKYTLFNSNNGSIATQQINISFENGISRTGTVNCQDSINVSSSYSEICSDITNGSIIDGTSTYTHPAFKFGDTELRGIWFGKFEAGGASNLITVKPNVTSLMFLDLSTAFTSASNISNIYSINANTHIMKNMEWGAVAYLTQSKYGMCTSGTCTEVWRNPNNLNKTGQAGTTIEAASTNTTYNYDDTQYGVKASSTGNIYGIYDLNGGAMETVMSNEINNSGNFQLSSSGFISAPESKYYDKYSYSESSGQNRGKLGDATKETMSAYATTTGSWYTAYSYMVISTYGPILTRGGSWGDGANSGVYSYNISSGVNVYFHPVITTN